jgi:hypothetical protein
MFVRLLAVLQHSSAPEAPISLPARQSRRTSRPAPALTLFLPSPNALREANLFSFLPPPASIEANLPLLHHAPRSEAQHRLHFPTRVSPIFFLHRSLIFRHPRSFLHRPDYLQAACGCPTYGGPHLAHKTPLHHPPLSSLFSPPNITARDNRLLKTTLLCAPWLLEPVEASLSLCSPAFFLVPEQR